MNNAISFNPKWLKAAAVIAARQDIRYYLNGVLVEVFPHEARLVATDGHRMVILRKLVEDSAPVRFIVPNEIIAMLKVNPKFEKIEATFTYEPANPLAKVVLEYLGVGIQFTPIDGRFPDYTQTMNKAAKPSGETSFFNPTFLMDFKRAADTAFGKRYMEAPVIWHNGGEPAAVTYKGRDDFFGIVMPLRKTETFRAPAWTLPLPAEHADRSQQEEAVTA